MSSVTETINIENVVASSGVDQEIDLESVAAAVPGADYSPEKFPGLVYRMQEPKAAALIFRSGNLVCTGAKSVDGVTEAIDRVMGEFRSLGVDTPETPDIHVQNIVSSADLGERLDLNAIAIGLGLHVVEYEPEQFPGLVYRMSDPDVAALLFGSGKLVITGANETGSVRRALESIDRDLSELGLR